jgi:hypothetical protein
MLLCASCFAETVATSQNKGGGLMVLTDLKCKRENTRIIYSQHPGYNTITGCWFIDELFVHVFWDDGDFRSYPIANWSVKDKKETY